MTLSFRNGLITFFLVLAGIICGFISYAALTAGQIYGWDAAIPIQAKVLFWFWRKPAISVSLALAMGEILFLIPVILGGLFYLRLVFRKTTAPEVFFLVVFLFSFCGELLKFLQVFFILGDQPFFLGIILTRIVWVFRFFGLFSFFCAGLYAMNFAYQKFGNLVALTFAIALVLAFNLPLETSIIGGNLLYVSVEEWGLGLIFLLLGLLAVGNFVLSAMTKAKENAPSFFLASLFIFVGWQCTLFGLFWAPLLSIPGFIILGRKTQESYLWD